MEYLQVVQNALEKRGFQTQVFSTSEEAKAYVLSAISPTQTVGIGGSVTVRDMGLAEALSDRGNPVYWHWREEGPNREAAHQTAATADVYLTSTNALTMTGQVVNIDGHGNRVSALLHGPGRVFILVGKNKLATNYDAAIQHIKTVSCPANARRLKLDTPCASLGYCTDCHSPQRMCSATVVLERNPSSHPMEILLIDQVLGV